MKLNQKNDQPDLIEIVENVPGFFFDSKNKINLKFTNDDILEEFQ
jgi:hypothetical protein